MIQRLSILFLLFAIVSCKKKDTCSLNPPVAVFNFSHPSISKHSFSIDSTSIGNTVTGLQSVEKVLLADSTLYKNPMVLELFQQGCNYVYQQFNFSTVLPVEGNLNEIADSTWIKISTEQFKKLSMLDTRLSAYKQWHDVIDEFNSFIPMELGEEYEIDESTFTKIDKIISDDRFIIMISIYNGKETE